MNAKLKSLEKELKVNKSKKNIFWIKIQFFFFFKETQEKIIKIEDDKKSLEKLNNELMSNSKVFV